MEVSVPVPPRHLDLATLPRSACCAVVGGPDEWRAGLCRALVAAIAEASPAPPEVLEADCGTADGRAALEAFVGRRRAHRRSKAAFLAGEGGAGAVAVVDGGWAAAEGAEGSEALRTIVYNGRYLETALIWLQRDAAEPLAAPNLASNVDFFFLFADTKTDLRKLYESCTRFSIPTFAEFEARMRETAASGATCMVIDQTARTPQDTVRSWRADDSQN